jgi:hypothetical protein
MIGPSIDEVVNFLHRANKAELARLVDSSPDELRPELQVGGVAGRRDPLLVPRAEVCIAALKEVVSLCGVALEQAGARLRWARRLGLAAGAATLLGSSSVLATLAADYRTLAIGSGVLALAGSVLTFVADYVTRPGQERSGSLFGLYLQLSEAQFKARQLEADLSVHVEVGVTPKREPQVTRLIEEANALCLVLIKLAATVSIFPSR